MPVNCIRRTGRIVSAFAVFVRVAVGLGVDFIVRTGGLKSQLLRTVRLYYKPDIPNKARAIFPKNRKFILSILSEKRNFL